ncbi:MAG: hypothetical protein C4581_14050 [Nitrospiraceae bacterium]|nr:MAG: hypothetical protein C4581_14050 [Nitrospiraceae bacterium]
MKQCAIKIVSLIVSSAITAVLLYGQTYALDYYHISRPRLGFEVSYEFERDKRSGPFIERRNDTTTYSERLDIDTNGWFYHKALVEFDLTLSPEWEQITEESEDTDKEESRTFLQGYDAEFVFLQYKPYTLTLFGNKRLSTLNSNLAQKSKIEADTYGARLNLKYKVLPAILDYTHYDSKQSGFIDASTTKDEVRLNMRHDEHFGNTRLDMVYTDVVDSARLTELSLISKEVFLQNIYNFQGGTKASLTSSAGYRDRKSDTYLERGLSWYENLLLNHKRNLTTNYNLHYESYDLGDSKRREYQSLDFQLNHLLYENLTTSLRADTSKNHNDSGQDSSYRTGLEWGYFRKIPGGSINATMSHAYMIVDRQPNLSAIMTEVRDEVKLLSGNSMVFLGNRNVEKASIRVIEKKADGLRGQIYLENTDYEVAVIGDYTAISRKTGTTTIPDGAEVFIDYEYVSEPPFDYGVFDRSYGMTFNLWNSLKIHYRLIRSKQRFLRGAEPDTLRRYNNETIGLEYRWKWSTTAVEYSNISSTERPTEGWKATEVLVFRPTDRSYLNFSAAAGATRFKELGGADDSEKYQQYKANYQMMLSQRQRLSAENFLNRTSGVIHKTQDAGFSAAYEWSYNIYKGLIKYTVSNEKNMTSRENFINHLVMVTIKRELF